MSKEKRMMNKRKSNNRNNKIIEKKTIAQHVTNIVGNKKLLITMIVTVLVLITLLSTSFAMLMKSASSGSEKYLETGNLVVKLDKDNEGNAIELNPTKPVNDEYGMATVKPYTFTIKNTGTTNASYEVYLDETITNDSLTPDEVRRYIRYQIDDETPKSLAGQGSNIIVRGGIGPQNTLTFKLKLWIDIDAPNTIEGTIYKAKVGVKGKATNKMQPNGPELVDGLIPVVYDEKNDTWIKADTSTSWYNYEIQEWANAVTVTSNKRETYLSAKAGTTISMNDINSMWVWVPRYKYRIPSNIGVGTLTPPEIDVIFESRYEATGVSESIYRSSIQENGTINDSLNGDKKIYYTHPAFRNIDNIQYAENTKSKGGWDKELTGMWVGKFESGTDNNTCNTSPSDVNCINVDPIIKPDVKSLIYQNIKNQFITSLKLTNGKYDETTGIVTFSENNKNKYGLNIKNNLSDSHLMKNTEWGMVAYLSQSRYGKMGNKNFESANKEIYKNDSTIYTGRSEGLAPATSNNTESGTYSYNDNKCNTTDTNKCTGEKEKYKGTGASTTGSIYGIYGFVGGAIENVMMYSNAQVEPYFSTSLPAEKYYDSYYLTAKHSPIIDDIILGDALYETRSWYNDYYVLAADYEKNWIYRGGMASDGEIAGIFEIANMQSGGSSSDVSFRVTLIP